MVTFSKIIHVPVIAANGIKQYLGSSKELRAGIRKYGYYNAISVMNGSEVDIEIELQLSKKFPIPAGNILDQSNLIYDAFNIKNVNTITATPAGVIDVVCSVEGV